MGIFASVPAASRQGSAICDSYAAAASHLDVGHSAIYAGDDAVCAYKIRRLSHRPSLVVVALLLGIDQHAADAFRSDLSRLHFATLQHHASPVVSCGRPCPVLSAPDSGLVSYSSCIHHDGGVGTLVDPGRVVQNLPNGNFCSANLLGPSAPLALCTLLFAFTLFPMLFSSCNPAPMNRKHQF